MDTHEELEQSDKPQTTPVLRPILGEVIKSDKANAINNSIPPLTGITSVRATYPYDTVSYREYVFSCNYLP